MMKFILTAGSVPAPGQRVYWVASDLNSIPPGSVLINPQTGRDCLILVTSFISWLEKKYHFTGFIIIILTQSKIRRFFFLFSSTGLDRILWSKYFLTELWASHLQKLLMGHPLRLVFVFVFFCVQTVSSSSEWATVLLRDTNCRFKWGDTGPFYLVI